MKTTFIGLVLMLMSFSVAEDDVLIGASFSGTVRTDVLTMSSQYGSFKAQRILMHRSSKRIKAKYFAFKSPTQSVPERFNKWKQGKKIIMYASAAYIAPTARKPEGLTIDNGIVVNSTFVSGEMEALVIVEAVGGVRISNIEDGNLNIYNPKKESVDINDMFERSRFINWAKDKYATCFQTHLLAYRDNGMERLKTDAVHGRVRQRERRMLALCQDGSEVFHVIYNIPDDNVYMYDAAKAIRDNVNASSGLGGLGMSLIALANLDVGAQDVFQLYDERGYALSGFTGPVDLREATNLLVYYYE